MNLADFQANDLTGLVVAEMLYRLGIEDVVASPGSRSTPLTCAFAMDGRFSVYPVLDERSAGFFALGIAKSKRKPVVLLCTSGTATANYLPAIVEARYSHTPLLVLTTDRPPQQQDCHAGQTVDQVGMYRSYVNWQHNLAVPRSTEQHLRYVRETIKTALVRSLEPQAGVAHLNFPFEEPLCPEFDEPTRDAMKAFVLGLLESNLDLPATVADDSQTPISEKLREILQENQRAMIVVGPGYYGNSDSVTGDILEISKSLAAPILADALNPFRNCIDAEASIIRNYEFILRSEKMLSDLRPDLVFQLGDFPTSKTLRAALREWDAPLIRLGKGIDNRDPEFSRLIASEVSISGLRRTLLNRGSDSGYRDDWIRIDRELDSVKLSVLESTAPWTESRLCHELSGIIASPCDLFVSNSMIVRDMEVFWSGNSHVRRVICNRGANGIDGIVSTAFGTAKPDHPVICLIGDLAFLHDAGGLLLKKQLSENQRIAFLVLDNHGGGIFEHLPISKHNPPYEEYFATPQDVDVQKLCDAYQLRYVALGDPQSLRGSLKSFLEEDTDSVCLHLRFDRKESYRVRKEVTASTIELLNQL